MSGSLFVDIGVFLGVAVVALVGGLAFGRFFVAPRLTRQMDQDDEEPGGRDD